MIRFEFGFKKGCLIEFFQDIEGLEHQFELRYGVFHKGTAHAEILTSDEDKEEMERLLNKYGIRYELERIL